MRRKTWALIALFLSFSLQAKILFLDGALSTREASTKVIKSLNEWKVSFLIPQIDVQEVVATPLGKGFSQFKIKGLKNAQTPGAPSLPFYSFIVASDKGDLEVTTDFSEEVIFSDLKAIPALDKPCRCQKGRALATLKEREYFQEAPVSLHSLGDYRGRALTLVVIRPLLQWGDQIKGLKNLEVTVTSQSGPLFSMDRLKEANKKMLLIAPEHLSQGMREYAEYKESLGFEVESFIYESVASNETELKAFIHKHYKQTSFQYALIFGFENDIPPFRVMTSANPQTPSDFPFFAMGGANDTIPDVFYGRIVARNNDDIRRQIEKSREFETKSWFNAQGRRSTIGIASNEGWNPTDVEYIQSMLGPLESSLQLSPTYFLQDNQNSNPTEINRTLNQGAIWLNYIGHGSGTSWSSITKDEYTSQNIAGIKEGQVKPVIIDVACQNGRFNNQKRLGETFLLAHKKGMPTGAVAFYGGSVDISWDPPAVMAVAINEGLAKNKKGNLFEIIMKGQLHLLSDYEDVEAAKENLLWYHLLGDPSLRVDF